MKIFRQLIFAVTLTAIIGVLTYTAVSRYVVHKAEENLQSIILSHRSFHQYIQRVMHPTYYKAKDAGKVAEDFYAPEILSSSYVIRVMHGFFNEERAKAGLPIVYYKLASSNPRNPVNIADEREAYLIRLFNEQRDLKDHTDIKTINGKKYLLYAKPFLETNQACTRCHGRREDAPIGLQQIYSGQGGFNESAGVIRAIESIRVPIDDEFSAAFVATTASLSAALILATLYFFNLRLRQRVRQSTSALAASEENYRHFTSLTSDYVHKCARKGSAPYRIQWIGGALNSISGYSTEEMLERGCWISIVHPDDKNATTTVLDTLKPGDIKELTFRIITKDQSVRWISDKCHCDRGGSEDELVLYGAGTDITERKRTEEERINLERQLLHTQKLESLGVLAGGIAHDFNNLLTAIVGNTDLALLRLNPESPVRDNLQRVEQAATRAADLAKQMLAYSGKGKFVIEPIDLNRLIDEMTHMLEVSISKKAVLRFNSHDALPTIEGDATQLRQIIMNLVINASEAIGNKSGVIAVSTGCMQCDRRYLSSAWLKENIPEGLYVWLEIADSGCGMDKETVSKIFDPFFTTKFTGRGLGMAAVLGIVRGHKGAIKVYSEPGRGTTFKVLLPAGDKPKELFNGSSDLYEEWIGSGTVLLVDDEETVIGIGSEMLKELGFDVLTAKDGREALKIFKKNMDSVYCVILDLTMPHLDGEQTFRELRLIKPDVKVIMSSGYNELEVTQRFSGKGLAGFIQKPYKLSTLKESVRNVEW